MATMTKPGALPVASDDIHGEITAAWVRIQAMPCTGTLIDALSSALWPGPDEHGIEAGSDDPDLFEVPPVLTA